METQEMLSEQLRDHWPRKGNSEILTFLDILATSSKHILLLRAIICSTVSEKKKDFMVNMKKHTY